MREVYDLDSRALTKFPARTKNCISPDFDSSLPGVLPSLKGEVTARDLAGTICSGSAC
jgi:glycerol-3-phosphate responsive antiterminator